MYHESIHQEPPSTELRTEINRRIDLINDNSVYLHAENWKE